MRIWKYQVFLWELSQKPWDLTQNLSPKYFLCGGLHNCIWVLVNGQQEKGSIPAFYLRVFPCWSLLILLIMTHTISSLMSFLALSNHVLTCSFTLKDISPHLIPSICLLPQQKIQISLHQIVLFIPSKLPLPNIFPVQILPCLVQVSCGVWIMIGARETVAGEMSKKILVH